MSISGKKEIEDFGVNKFVLECKNNVFKYVEMWEEIPSSLSPLNSLMISYSVSPKTFKRSFANI